MASCFCPSLFGPVTSTNGYDMLINFDGICPRSASIFMTILNFEKHGNPW